MKKVTRSGEIKEIKHSEPVMQGGEPINLVTTINPENIIRNSGCKVCDERNAHQDNLRRDIILQNGLRRVADIVGALSNLPDLNYGDVRKKLVNVAVDECGKILYKELELPHSITTRSIRLCRVGPVDTPEIDVSSVYKEMPEDIDEDLSDLCIPELYSYAKDRSFLKSIKESDEPRQIKINKLFEFITDTLAKHNFVETKECQEALTYVEELKSERRKAEKRLGKYMQVLPKEEGYSHINIDITKDVENCIKGLPPAHGLPNEVNMLPLDEVEDSIKEAELKIQRKWANEFKKFKNTDIKEIFNDVSSLGKFNNMVKQSKEHCEKLSQALETKDKKFIDQPKTKKDLAFLKASAASKKGWETRRKNTKKGK